MAGASPNKKTISDIKSKVLNLAQTSVYQVKIQPPKSVSDYLNNNKNFDYNDSVNGGEFIELLCSSASLPGSRLATHTSNSYNGFEQRMAYRRQYDDALNLEFYVDRNYTPIKFFEGWVDYISGNTNDVSHYRMKYPKDKKGGYWSDNVYVTKFEKNEGESLEYQFLEAFPLNISSIPVSYGNSDILRYNVSIAYTRYKRN